MRTVVVIGTRHVDVHRRERVDGATGAVRIVNPRNRTFGERPTADTADPIDLDVVAFVCQLLDDGGGGLIDARVGDRGRRSGQGRRCETASQRRRGDPTRYARHIINDAPRRRQPGIFDSILSATSDADVMGVGCRGLHACTSTITLAVTPRTRWHDRVWSPSPRV